MKKENTNTTVTTNTATEKAPVVKKTKKQNYATLRELVEETDRPDKDMLIAFIDKEVSLLESRLERTNEKKSKGASEILKAIKEVLAEKGTPMCIADLTADKRLETYKDGEETKKMTPQKLVAMLKKLVDAGEVKKEYKEKKKPYYSLA